MSKILTTITFALFITLNVQAQIITKPVFTKHITVTSKTDSNGKETMDTIITESVSYSNIDTMKHKAKTTLEVLKSVDVNGKVTYDTIEIYSPTPYNSHGLGTENEESIIFSAFGNKCNDGRAPHDKGNCNLACKGKCDASCKEKCDVICIEKCDATCKEKVDQNYVCEGCGKGPKFCHPPMHFRGTPYMNGQAIPGTNDVDIILPDFDIHNFARYQHNRNVGIGLMVGGAVVGVGGMTMFAFSFVKKDGSGEHYFSDNPRPALAIIGGGVTLLGTAALTTGTAMTIINSIKLNKWRSNMPGHRMGSVDLISNDNGIGFAFNF